MGSEVHQVLDLTKSIDKAAGGCFEYSFNDIYLYFRIVIWAGNWLWNEVEGSDCICDILSMK